MLHGVRCVACGAVHRVMCGDIATHYNRHVWCVLFSLRACGDRWIYWGGGVLQRALRGGVVVVVVVI